MRRREFLTGSDRAGHAVAFPTVSTARQSRERLRVGIIGTGRRADADRGLRRSRRSAITPLSEQAITQGNKTPEFPDFTDDD